MRLPFQRKNQPAAARDSPKPLRSDAFLLEAMDAWGDVVYRVALAQTGSPSDADDVFQTPSRACGTRVNASESTSTGKPGCCKHRHGEPLPRLGAFDLEPPHGRLHAGACRHPRPRHVRRRHLGGRGRVAARPAHPGAPVLRRGLRHRRDRAHHGMPTAPCEPASTAPASSCGTCWKTTAANASRALQAAATPCAERSRTVTDPRNPGPRPTVDEYRTMMRGTHVPPAEASDPERSGQAPGPQR